MSAAELLFAGSPAIRPLTLAVSKIEPRPYQSDGVGAARRIVAAACLALLLVLATGGGKTVIAVQIALGALRKGKRVLFVAPRREIIAQTYWKLVDAGVPEEHAGVIMADGVIPHAVTRKPYRAKRDGAAVQVASIQTLANRELPDVDVVFIDEAHHATSPTWSRVISHYKAKGVPVIGLTATPVRSDGAGLGTVFDQLHEIATYAQLVELGYLVAPRVFTTPKGPDLSKVKVARGGDYDHGQLDEAMRDRALVGDVVEHWKRHAGDRTTVVFGSSIEHSKDLCAAFCEAGIAAEHLDGTTDDDVRDAILERLRSGATRVVCNFGVLTEGWDEPRVKCVVLARPTKSFSLFRQMVGRGARPWEGVSFVLLDHAGCVHEHGFPTEEVEWPLEGKMRRKAKAGVRECPSCFSSLAAGTKACPFCGHLFAVEEREAPEHVDGQLVELTGPTNTKSKADARAERLRRDIARWATAQDKARGWAPGQTNKHLAAHHGSRARMGIEGLERVWAWINASEFEQRFPRPAARVVSPLAPFMGVTQAIPGPAGPSSLQGDVLDHARAVNALFDEIAVRDAGQCPGADLGAARALLDAIERWARGGAPVRAMDYYSDTLSLLPVGAPVYWLTKAIWYLAAASEGVGVMVGYCRDALVRALGEEPHERPHTRGRVRVDALVNARPMVAPAAPAWLRLDEGDELTEVAL